MVCATTGEKRSAYALRYVLLACFLAVAAVLIFTSLTDDSDSSATIEEDWEYNTEFSMLIYNGLPSMPDYTEDVNPVTALSASRAVEIVFNTQINRIGAYAFCGCIELEELGNGKIPTSVKTIGEGSFKGCSKLTTVFLPYTISTINKEAFCGCSMLRTVEMQPNVKNINEGVFCGCSSLESVTIPEAVTIVGARCFMDCTSLKSVTFRCADLKNFNASIFKNCKSLFSIDLPETVRYIYASAFSGCSSLVYVSLSSNLISIDQYAFEDCTSLVTIELPSKLRTIENYAFKGCKYLYEVCNGSDSLRLTIGSSTNGGVAYYAKNIRKPTQQSIITYLDERQTENHGLYAFMDIDEHSYLARYVGSDRDITIPRGYDHGELISEFDIYTDAFRGCEVLTSVNIPSSVKNFGDGAFFGCTSLATVNMELGPISMGISVFENCSALKAIELPNTMTSIGKRCFYGCTSLRSAVLSDNLVFLDEETFRECTSLSTVNFGSMVSTLGVSSFEKCTSLASVNIPSVRAVYNRAFYDCSSLETVTFGGLLLHIYQEAFGRCLKLTSVEIPQSVTEVDWAAFAQCTSLSSAVINGNIALLSDETFMGCSSLESVTLSNSITAIGDGVFYSCSKLRSVGFPANLLSIGERAFSNCLSMREAVFNDKLSSIGSQSFSNCVELEKVTVSRGMHTIGDNAFIHCDKLRLVENRSFLNIQKGSRDFGMIAYRAEFVVGSVLTVSTDTFDLLYNDTSKICRIVKYKGRESSVELREIDIGTMNLAVISIGDGAFKNCDFVRSVRIYSSAESIGSEAFYGCTGLTEIVVPTTLQTIGNGAFEGCSALDRIDITKEVQTIGDRAFKGCTSLFSVVISHSVLSIGESAFEDCTLLRDVIFGNSVRVIGDRAFMNCSSLRNVTIPESVQSIGDFVFSDCPSLVSIDVDPKNINYVSEDGVLYDFAMSELIEYPMGREDTKYTVNSSVRTIRGGAFAGNVHLTTVTMPMGLESVLDGAFSECTALQSVSLIDVSYIGEHVFYGCSSLLWVGVNETNSHYHTDNGVLYTKGMDTVILYPAAKSGLSYAIDERAVTIKEYAFYGCLNLSELTIPAGVTSIGQFAMACPNLTKLVFAAADCADFAVDADTFVGAGSKGAGIAVEFTDDVKHIPANMFYAKSGASAKVLSATVGTGVTSIGDNAFRGCGYLSYIELSSRHCADATDKSRLFEGAGVDGDGIEVVFRDTVTSIPKYMFRSENVPKVLSVSTGDGVATIGAYAFYESTGMKKLTVGKNVRSIGEFAFFDCTGLEELIFDSDSCSDMFEDFNVFYNAGTAGAGIRVVIGNDVTNIPAYLFYTRDPNKSANIVTLDMGPSVRSIGSYAFYHCQNLQSVIMPNTVANIHQYSFAYCSGLSSLTIGSGVTTIGTAAFYNCYSLSVLNFYARDCTDFYPSSNIFYSAGASGNGIDVFFYDTVTKVPANFFNVDNLKCSPKLNMISVGTSVRSIGVNAFYNCTTVSSLIFNAERCTDFEQTSNIFYNVGTFGGGFGVMIGSTVTRVPANMFYIPDDGGTDRSPKVISLTIGSSVATIGKNAFNGLEYVETVTFNAVACGDLDIFSNAFSNVGKAAGRVYLSFGNDVTHIPAYLFCSSNMSIPTNIVSITMGKNIASIGKYAFYNSTSLIALSFDAEDCRDLTADSNVFYRAGAESTGMHVTFGNNIKHVPAYMFYIPDASGSPAIDTLVLGESIRTIGEYAFASCSTIETITVGRGVERIGDCAFRGCVSLKTLEYNAVACANLQTSSNVFGGAGKNSGGVDVVFGYEVERIPAYLFQSRFDGEMSNIRTVTMSESVSLIGSGAFSACGNLESVNIGKGVTAIGGEAFADCISLREIIFGARHCGDLRETNNAMKRAGIGGSGITVTFTDDVECVPAYLFYTTMSSDRANVLSVTFGKSIVSIGSYSFGGCSVIKDMVIPDGVTVIGDGAFSGCSSMGTLVIGKGVMDLGSQAFRDCSSLVSIRFDAKDCRNLTYESSVFRSAGTGGSGISLTFGDEVNSIPAYAFYESRPTDSPKIVDITVSKKVSFIGSYAFGNCLSVLSINYNAENCSDVITTGDLFSNTGRGTEGMTVTIGNGVRRIPSYLFYVNDPQQSPNIRTLRIGTGIEAIGNRSFENCISLTEIVYDAVSCADMVYSSDAFSNIGNDTDGVSVTFGSSVVSIPAYLFNSSVDKNSPNIVSVVMGNSVTSIGKYAFGGCSSISSVVLSEEIVSIGESAFIGCSSLGSVNIPAKTGYIGPLAFSGCSSLKAVEVNGDNECYRSDNGVLFTKDRRTLILYPAAKEGESYSVPDRVVELSDRAFEGNTSLRSLYLCVTLKTVGDAVLPECITELRIGSSFDRVGSTHAPDTVTSFSFYNGSSGFGNIVNGFTFYDEEGVKIRDTSELSGKIYTMSSEGKMMYSGEAGEPPSRPVDPWIEISGNPMILIVAAVAAVAGLGILFLRRRA